MAKLDLEFFRDRLRTMRAELIETDGAGDEATAPVELDQSRIGRLSRMDALQGQAMSVEMRRRRRAARHRIDQALARLEEGDYGLCEACGEPIATARLELDPAATHCIRCAAEAEAR